METKPDKKKKKSVKKEPDAKKKIKKPDAKEPDAKKPVKKPDAKEPKVKKNKLIILHDDHSKPELNENKYSEKLKSLLNKKKSQASTDPDVKIRFGWKF
jgi:hypothetical protein